MITAKRIKYLLNLQPLPDEGGLYAEMYRSEERIPDVVLPDRYIGDRPYSSAIYYLLEPDNFSAMHRLISDEIYHFYLGDPVELLLLLPDGTGKVVLLGPDMEHGMRPQFVVPRGVWQGSRLIPGGKFALMGTTVSPGFDFHDFELANRIDLLDTYPGNEFGNMIVHLTR